MKFQATFCDPFRSDIIQLGDIDQDTIIERFRSIDWSGYLERMQAAAETDIYFSPSFEIENKENRHSITISAVGIQSDFEFYIFYKRPKEVKTFLGLGKPAVKDFMSESTGQTEADAVQCLEALIAGNFSFLEQKIKS